MRKLKDVNWKDLLTGLIKKRRFLVSFAVGLVVTSLVAAAGALADYSSRTESGIAASVRWQ